MFTTCSGVSTVMVDKLGKLNLLSYTNQNELHCCTLDDGIQAEDEEDSQIRQIVQNNYSEARFKA